MNIKIQESIIDSFKNRSILIFIDHLLEKKRKKELLEKTATIRDFLARKYNIPRIEEAVSKLNLSTMTRLDRFVSMQSLRDRVQNSCPLAAVKKSI